MKNPTKTTKKKRKKKEKEKEERWRENNCVTTEAARSPVGLLICINWGVVDLHI